MSASGLRKTSPSRLAPLRPAPSLSSLHIHGHGLEHLASPSVPPTSQALESSSSSVFTVDLNEGILLQSEDTETEEAEELTAISRESDVDRIDEDSKRTLRDQLRRTLSSKASGAGGVSCIHPLIKCFTNKTRHCSSSLSCQRETAAHS